MKKYQYVKENISHLRRLHKSGDLSSKTLSHYRIYTAFQAYAHIKSKEQRYQAVADDMRIAPITVKRAVKNMETLI